jgi:hypothetical protein
VKVLVADLEDALRAGAPAIESAVTAEATSNDRVSEKATA